jgi:glycosyltransferase involved in cell wall biosynthesis
VVTDAEAELYRRQLHVRDVRVLPNVLDLSRYQLRLPEEEGAIVYTGLYAYGPNELAAMALIECSRRLRENGVPHHVYLVGRQPTQKMRDAAAGHEQITITGEVADSHPYIARASVLAVPLATGGGTKFKILEAMALGRCVLTTPIGAEGMRLTPGIHAAITGLDEFEPELENLLKDPARRAELAGAGQRFVRENFSTQVLQARLKQCLADAGF